MPALFEILHLLTAPHGYLTEIRRLDQPGDAPASQRFLWLWLHNETVNSLQFVSMQAAAHEQRSFREGELRFDEACGELRWASGHCVALRVDPSKSMPPPLIQLINQHLS